MFDFHSKSIKTKITVAIIGLLIVIFGLSWGYSYWNLYKNTQMDQKEQAQTIAKLISGIASYTFLTEDYTMLDEMLQKAMENDSVLYVKILDKDGNPKRENKKDRTDNRFLEIKEPIMVAEAAAGSVLLGFSTEKKHAGLMKDVRITLIQVLIGLALSAAFLIFLLNRLIIRPISILDSKARAIAVGDLTSSVEISGEDEIASLGNSINSMAVSLKEMIYNIRGITATVSDVAGNISVSSNRVMSGATIQKNAIGETALAIDDMNNSISGIAASAGGLTELSQNTASSIIQMDSAIVKIAESSGVFNEYAEETASSVQEMIASIRQIADNLGNLSASSEATSSAIYEISASVKEVEQSAKESVGLAEKVDDYASNQGMNALNAAMKGMSDIKENVAAISEIINRLGKKSENIGKVLTVIYDVTDQTNLLALNAAILAAQAGEHGRGFSIVADEIKDLSERTFTSTREIANLIESVQEETRSSVNMTAKGIQIVEKGILLFKDVAGALGSIVTSSRTSTEMAKAIQRAAQEEVVSINQITDSIKVMADQIAQIANATGEQSKGSKFISEAAEKMKNESGQVRNATLEQTKGSKYITGAIESVTEQTAQIARATNLQREGSTGIVTAIDKIHETTDELISSSAEMDSAINVLKEEAQRLLLEVHKFKV